MPFRGRRQYKKTARSSSRAVSVYKSTKPTKIASIPKKSFNSAVRRVIKQEMEVKTAPNLTVFDQATVKGTGLDYNNGFGLTSLNIVPSVANGPNEGQRIGNIVKPKRLVLRYTIRANPVTAAGGTNPKPALPFLCRVIVYRHRYAMDDPSNNAIIDVGGANTNLASTPDYWIEPYNRKEFLIVHSKQWLMQPITNNSGASTVADNVAHGTKQFLTHKTTIPMPRKLLYNDLGSVATNCSFYMAVACCNTDGTSDLANIFRAQVNAETYLYFTDA